MDMTLAELGEVSKSYAYDGYEPVSKIKVKIPGQGVAGNIVGGAKKQASRVSDNAAREFGRRVGHQATKPARDMADKVNSGMADAMTSNGNALGRAVGNQVKNRVDAATKKAVILGSTAGAVGIGGTAGTYEVLRRREHKRAVERAYMEAMVADRKRQAGKV